MMGAFYTDEKSVVIHSSALEALKEMPDNSVDSIVTDPPYALTELDSSRVSKALSEWLGGNRSYVPSAGKGFRGMDWDKFVPPPSLWDECFRVLKPGGHLLSFAGSRTQDIMGISIRLAGFSIKDGIGWVTSQGFPKSMDAKKAVAKKYGEQEAANWDGYGTMMKPSFEPIIVAHKPMSEKSIADNLLKHGVGVLNIDATRVGGDAKDSAGNPIGRWTPNFVLAHNEGCIEIASKEGTFVRNRTEKWSGFGQKERPAYTSEVITFVTPVFQCEANCPVRILAEDTGQKIDEHGRGVLSQFFPAFMYHKKAGKKEKPLSDDGGSHVSVKPLGLMRWLVRLVTPTGGVVLDPFLGSGTTVEAARLENIRSIGIEGQIAYLPMTKQRVERS